MTRYGAGELYGFDLASLPPQRLRELSSAKNKEIACPFKMPEPGKSQPTCSKKGGVCSLRQFEQDKDGRVSPAGSPVTTCPQRFLEGNLIFEWVGETLLGRHQRWPSRMRGSCVPKAGVEPSFSNAKRSMLARKPSTSSGRTGP